MSLSFEKHNGCEYINYTDPLDRDITLIKKEGKLINIVDSLFRSPYVITPDSAKFIVLGDMHGHIIDTVKAITGWEKYTGIKVDQWLQVGDIGAASYNSNIDKTTRQMAQRDPSELDFLNFHHKQFGIGISYDLQKVLLNKQIYFTDGNHDDELFLYDNYYKENPGKDDHFRYIPTGKIIRTNNNNHNISIGAIGFNKQRKSNDTKAYHADVLLTHVPPKTVNYPFGDLEISDYLANQSPIYHFFGHARDAPLLSNPDKNSFGLEAVYFPKSGIQEGAIGFLDIKNPREHKFIYIPEKLLNELSRVY